METFISLSGIHTGPSSAVGGQSKLGASFADKTRINERLARIFEHVTEELRSPCAAFCWHNSAAEAIVFEASIVTFATTHTTKGDDFSKTELAIVSY